MALAAATALAGGHDDGVIADVRPREPQQVAETQAGIGGEIDCIGHFNRAGLFQANDVCVSPDDITSIIGVELR
jgi:hypothetical protein